MVRPEGVGRFRRPQLKNDIDIKEKNMKLSIILPVIAALTLAACGNLSKVSKEGKIGRAHV